VAGLLVGTSGIVPGNSAGAVEQNQISRFGIAKTHALFPKMLAATNCGAGF
jgi:hypothetical protein